MNSKFWFSFHICTMHFFKQLNIHPLSFHLLSAFVLVLFFLSMLKLTCCFYKNHLESTLVA